MTVQSPVTAPGFLEALQAALGRHYRIEREIGRGGMGLVYLARDLTLDRDVAVKVVHPDHSTNRAVAARFLAEARTVAKLRHPNIVAVHAAGEVGGQLYYVMDYHAGETLRQRLEREGPLPPAVAVKIATDIADALDAAVAAEIVHRDLKPENILLEGPSGEPRALLADFGIARLAEGGGATGPGAVMGTPAYMSPEQAAGEELDGRSDLYSLGVVSYEMLVGTPPFTGPPRTIISRQILDPPPPLDLARPGLPPEVVGAIHRALEKTPEARWHSGRAFRRALTGEITTPTPVHPARSRRRRLLLPLVSAVVVAGLAAAAVLFARPNGPPPGVDPRHSILVLPFANLRADPSYQWLEDGSVNMLTLALSQWRDLTVVDQDRVHDLMASAEVGNGAIGLAVARQLARRSRAWTVVLGDFELVGDSVHLVARPYDVATGRRLDVVRAAGAATIDVRSIFDELAAKLLDLTGAPKTGRSSLTSVTTESLEAYRAYLEGVDDLNHWRLADASAALKRAVALDTTFSLANYKLAVARGWVSPLDTTGKAAIRRAARTAEQLPQRERSLIEGYRTFVDGNYREGISIYGDLIQRDSTDVEAWYGLADAAFHGGYSAADVGLLNRSLTGFRRVIGLDSTYALAYEHVGAMLTDASLTRGWLRLAGGDSLARVGHNGPDAAPADRTRAGDQAIALALAWTRLQPSTPRAQYHLYKAYLANNRVGSARQTVQQLRGMYPDSLQAFFGLLDARAQFVGGDIRGAAQTVRAAIPAIRPEVFTVLDFAPEPLSDMLTGASALGYYGDLEGAVELIRLGRDLRARSAEERDSAEKAREDDLWELSRLGQLYGAAGVHPDRLRSLWARGLELVRNIPEGHRVPALSSLVPAAVALLLGPPGDASAVNELGRFTGTQLPPQLAALIAARADDTVAARRLLAEAQRRKADTTMAMGFEWGATNGDWRPVLAETYSELRDDSKVIEVLDGFGPAVFGRRGFDPRWILLPRVHLIRGQAFERLGRGLEAAAEYQGVIDQWGGADPELLPVVQLARQRLARVAGTPEVH